MGVDAATRSASSNTEIAGALAALASSAVQPVPIIRAWAMSGGPLERDAFAELRDSFREALRLAGPLDGLVLSLHGALVAVGEPDADASLLEDARDALGPDVPISVSLDLHANVTQRMVASATAIVGFRTYPHVDQAETGARAARVLLRLLDGESFGVALVKLPLILPAEPQAIAIEPMRSLRAFADAALDADVIDVSLFPVQPWLDVPEIGFGVTVLGRPEAGLLSVAEGIADRAWSAREEFVVELHDVDEALAEICKGVACRPAFLVHSADAPTGGGTGDSPAVLEALHRAPQKLRAVMDIVDVEAVARCYQAGIGASVELAIGASIDSRWSSPVRLTAIVRSTGDRPVVLGGPAMTGQEVSMGRWVLIETSREVLVLVTERPAPSFDPACFSSVGIDLDSLDAVTVRSPNMYRAGYGDFIASSFVLDLPGPTAPDLKRLTFTNGGQTCYPFMRRERGVPRQ